MGIARGESTLRPTCDETRCFGRPRRPSISWPACVAAVCCFFFSVLRRRPAGRLFVLFVSALFLSRGGDAPQGRPAVSLVRCLDAVVRRSGFNGLPLRARRGS